jgi:hypothetical protein
MKKHLLIFAFLGMAITAFAQYNEDNLNLETERQAEFTFQNLRLYPILANDIFRSAHRDIGQYTTLSQALETKKVVIYEQGSRPVDLPPLPETAESMINPETEIPEVREVVDPPEVEQLNAAPQIAIQQQEQNYNEPYAQIQQRVEGGGSGPAVNTLFIENLSADTVYLMAGEVIKGGRQDRVLAHDMVLPPGGLPVDLSVFCVEHGRWSYKESGAQNFGGYFKVSGVNVRKAAQMQEGQSRVWEEVENANKAFKVESETGAYTALEESEDYQKTLAGYLSHFEGLASDEGVIGVVAVTGDRVMVCDMFATHELFAAAFPNLLQSYATEAIGRGEAVSISDETVSAYLSKLIADEAAQDETIGENGQLFRHAGKKLHITTY